MKKSISVLQCRFQKVWVLGPVNFNVFVCVLVVGWWIRPVCVCNFGTSVSLHRAKWPHSRRRTLFRKALRPCGGITLKRSRSSALPYDSDLPCRLTVRESVCTNSFMWAQCIYVKLHSGSGGGGLADHDGAGGLRREQGPNWSGTSAH